MHISFLFPPTAAFGWSCFAMGHNLHRWLAKGFWQMVPTKPCKKSVACKIRSTCKVSGPWQRREKSRNEDIFFKVNNKKRSPALVYIVKLAIKLFEKVCHHMGRILRSPCTTWSVLWNRKIARISILCNYGDNIALLCNFHLKSLGRCSGMATPLQKPWKR